MAPQMNVYVSGVEAVIGHNFADPSKLWEALQAAGSPVRSIGTRLIPDGQKRQAMVGDPVLRLALVGHWYPGIEPRSK